MTETNFETIEFSVEDGVARLTVRNLAAVATLANADTGSTGVYRFNADWNAPLPITRPKTR